MQIHVIVGLVLTASAVWSWSAGAQGNAESGEEVFRKCRACHQVGLTAKNLVGPMLNDIVGRKAASIEGFKYSPVNQDAGAKGLVWTEENLSKYLDNPAAFMPQNRMAFPGLKDEQDRKDVIEYLKKFTKK